MANQIRRAGYFYTTVPDRPGEAYRLLSDLAAVRVDLLAFTAVPVGPYRTQLALFPDDEGSLREAGDRIGLDLDGPHWALIVQGDDEIGSLAAIHERLYEADVNVYAASGVTDGRGGFGYVLYVRPDDFEAAAKALGV
ncbi:MAG TPA: hypothetical protein VKB65_10590 [Myxococcota bacterium]|nr:hypothetical protein [Myxococcota bacterium]